MKKTSLLILLAVLTVLTLVFTVSCGGEDDTTPAVTTAGTPGTSDTSTNDTATNDTTTTTAEDTTTAEGPTVTTEPDTGVTMPKGDKLTSGEVALFSPVIVVDSEKEFDGVVRAASDLQNDFKMVTGKAPAVKATLESGAPSILVGTIGQSPMIDALVKNGTLDVSEIKDKWEGYHIGVYTGLAGNEKTVVIAGADMRGTIYGIYTLSEMIGVSPWYWWADVPVKENKSLSLAASALAVDECPDVKYRGIFINDEENFTFWSERFESVTSPGSPNPDTYKKVFELILRLKANTLWPAMHNLSDAFNKEINPETGIAYNAELANLYGVVMGSSHCELMLCNNETEWAPWCEANKGKYNLKKLNNDWKASYDYTVNAEAMNAYWEDRVAANYKFENIYTIGLRGVHDAEILCSALSDKSWASKATVVQSAVEAQLAILEKYEDLYEQEFGVRKEFVTTYCPYKEAAEYYKYDLSLPEDCIILFCDDNYGYVRQLPNEEEKETYAGFGVYYHVSYYGVPRSYLWVDTMPFIHIYEEMDKAYHAGNDDVWILNVGDLKPAEMSINFFMDLAFKNDSVSADTVDDYMKAYFEKTFGIASNNAGKLAEAMTEFYQLAYAYKPEYQGYGEGTEYSIVFVGDEAQRVINRVATVKVFADSILASLPKDMQAAFYQVVCYKINATLLTLQKNVYQQRSATYLAQGRFASVNLYAALSEAAHAAVLEELQYFNKELSGGKWDGIINPYQTAQWLPVIAGAPQVTYLPIDVADDGVGAAAEGQGGTAPIKLYFDSLTDDARFLDIFSKGTKGYAYKITADGMVKFSDADGEAFATTLAGGKVIYSGNVTVEERLFITIDWSKVTKEDSEATLTVSDDYGNSYTYTLVLHKSTVDPEADKAAGKIGYYETNGVIAMEAEHYSANVAVGDMKWQFMPGWGYTGGAMKNFPDLSSSSVRIDGNYETESPYQEYRFYVTHVGTYSGTFFRIPTLNEGNDYGIGRTNRTGWSFDGGDVQLFRGNSLVDTNGSSTWSNSVRVNMEKMAFSINVTTKGWHTLRIYRVDAGTAFDKIVLINKDMVNPVSRLGESESYSNIVPYVAPLRTKLPTLSFEGIKYGESQGSSLDFDLTGDPSKTQEGYTAVDLSSESVKTKRYAWTEGFSALQAAYRSKSKTSARDLGIIYSSSKATFSATVAKAGTYIVTVAVGDLQSNGVAVKNMTIASGETVYHQGINHAAGLGTVEYSFVVTVNDTSLPITFTGTWVVSAIEISPYVAVEKPLDGAFKPDANGDIIIEAEWALDESVASATSAASSDGKKYFMETGGLFGSAVYYGPNGEGSSTNTSVSAKLSFEVSGKSGTYNVYMLVKCQDDDDDSLIFSLDGGAETTANDFKHTGATYKWVKVGTVRLEDGKVSTLTVYGREDGLAIDRIVLTTKASWS